MSGNKVYFMQHEYSPEEILILWNNFNDEIHPYEILPHVKLVIFNDEYNQDFLKRAFHNDIEIIVLGSGYDKELKEDVISPNTKLYVHQNYTKPLPENRSCFVYMNDENEGFQLDHIDSTKWKIVKHPHLPLAREENRFVCYDIFCPNVRVWSVCIAPDIDI